MYPQYTDPAKQRREDITLALIVINVILVIVLGWTIYAKVINKPDTGSKKTSSTSESSNSSDSSSGDFDHNEASGNQENLSFTPEDQQLSQNQIASRNVQRKNDASSALNAAEEYISNNVGTLPTTFTNGQLRGTDPNDYPSSIEFQYYTGLDVHFSAQPKVATDTLVLVTGSTCNSDGSTSDSSSRSIAVLYGEEANDGTFEGVCVNN